MNISIYGTGNVAHSLGVALLNASHNILSIHGRNMESTSELALKLNSIACTIDESINSSVEVIILAISDNYIGEVSEQIVQTNKSCILVHTSGSIPLYILNSKFKQRGVLYPLQTFTKAKELDFSTIPICLNASDRPTLKVIRALSESLTKKIYILSDDERKKAHLAAVMVNNFTNHFISLAYDYLKKESIPIQIIQPLIRETMEKLLQSTPDTTQTGPARRNDTSTIEEHLKMLEGHSMKELYDTISQSIIDKHN